MAKKTDDYTYPDQTTNSEYTESATSENTENVQSLLMNKRIMVPLGIMALVILINIIWGGEDKKADNLVTDTKKEETKVESNDGVSAQELEFAKMQNELQAEKLSENKRAIDKVNQFNQQQRDQISAVKGKYSQLQTDIDELKRQNEQH